jgi:hypothetical protein
MLLKNNEGKYQKPGDAMNCFVFVDATGNLYAPLPWGDRNDFRTSIWTATL